MMTRNPQHKNNQISPLELAWQRYTQLDAGAVKTSAFYYQLRSWILVLGLLATLLAVLIEIYGSVGPLGRALGISLIVVPALSSVVVAFAHKFQQGERWLALRTGAEEIKKEIYLYRTLLQQEPDRDDWLAGRLAAIQRQVFETTGDFSLDPYTGPLPPNYDPNNKKSDPGFSDLLAQDYLQYRLQNQLDWHADALKKMKASRVRLHVAILIFSGLGTVLAGLANLPGMEMLSLWVAFTTALATMFASWVELRRMEATIENYSRLVLELNLIQEHWDGLPLSRRNGDEFFKTVLATERVLWSQHNRYVSEMRKAVAELQGMPVDTLDKVAAMPAPAAIDEAVIRQTQNTVMIATEAKLAARQPELPRPQPGWPHAFVLMPLGRHRAADGRWLDFDSIYRHLVEPALIQAGFRPFRAGLPGSNNQFQPNTFQELLLADLLLADVTLDQADTFYQLGVRHTLRKQGVIHINCNSFAPPLNASPVQTIAYTCNEYGKPNLPTLADEQQTLITVARETWSSAPPQGQSPVYNLLTGLAEPDRSQLHTVQAADYWREYREWQQQVELAQRKNHPGDILLLTEEVDNPVIREEAIGQAAATFSGLGYHALAYQQYRQGLSLNPDNADFRRQLAFELGRLNHPDEAQIKLAAIIKENPADAEAIAFLGRLSKEKWRAKWEHLDNIEQRCRTAYQTNLLLAKAFDNYLAAYKQNQNHYYSGINVVTLALVWLHVTRQVGVKVEPDSELAAIKAQLPSLMGAVKFTLTQAVKNNHDDYWAAVSLADMAVHTAKTPKEVTAAYRQALNAGQKSPAGIYSALEQLQMLQALAYRPEFTAAGITSLQKALEALPQVDFADLPEAAPQQVFLFSGHMIDQPGRADPRFPPAMEAEAHQKTETALDNLNAAPGDLAITAGVACGGDILFIESCLQRNMQVDIYLPYPQAEFVDHSVRFAGDEWVERYEKIRQHPNVTIYLQPERLGPCPVETNIYERNNRWAFYTALGYGLKRIRLIVLWNGSGGDGPGGTGHMVQEVRQLGGVVVHLDTSQFDYWQ